jgi:hypothetical protein
MVLPAPWLPPSRSNTSCGTVIVDESELQLLMNQNRPCAVVPDATVTFDDASAVHFDAIGLGTSHRTMSEANAGFGTVPT